MEATLKVGEKVVCGKAGTGSGCCSREVAQPHHHEHEHEHGHEYQEASKVCCHGKKDCPSTGKRCACSGCGCDDEEEGECGSGSCSLPTAQHSLDHDHDHGHGHPQAVVRDGTDLNRKFRTMDADEDDCCESGCCGKTALKGQASSQEGGDGCCGGGGGNYDHDHTHSHDGIGGRRTFDPDAESDCCADGCCGDRGGSCGDGGGTRFDHDHSAVDHSHEHSHRRALDPNADESDCCASGSCGNSRECCDSGGGGGRATVEHDHDHSHGCCADDEDDCCANGSCGSGVHIHEVAVVVHDHSHGHEHAVHCAAPQQAVPALHAPASCGDLEAAQATSGDIPLAAARVCASCDPSSPVAHAIQVTRFRVANLCCAGEEKIIREALAKMTGVEHVAVNVVGRYAVVKHCPVECCAPSAEIMKVLNDLRLGVSIHDVGDHDEDDKGGIWLAECNLTSLHVATVFALFIAGLGTYLHHSTHEESKWVFIASMVLGMPPIVKDACVSIFVRGCIDIHLLMVVAISGAIAGKEYFDGSLVVALFLTAELIEGMVMRYVQRAVRTSSASAMPKKAYLVSGKSVNVADLQIGDLVAIRAGEMVVCDGVVTKGEGVLDESSLTGESVPITKKVGSSVLSGTVVQNGYLEIKLEKSPQDSTFRRLQQAVEDVQADKGEYAKLVDSFSQYWTPLVLVTTFLLVVVGGAVSRNWWSYVNRGLVLLVLACPCAIVISAPIPAICAISVAAKSGVLVRGSSVIEKMSTVDTVAVDKTGTLTKGKFAVVGRLQFTDTDDYNPMELAVALEQRSTHPLANAVISDFCGCIADAEGITFPEVKKVKVIDGVGVEGWVLVNGNWIPVMVGNERLLKQNGGPVACTKARFTEIADFCTSHPSCVVLIVAIDDEVALLLALADEVRGESKDFVSALQSMGMTVTMLTGDHQDVAGQVCATLGIPPAECHARLRTDQKLQWIKEAQHMVADVLPGGDVNAAEEGRGGIVSKGESNNTKLRHVMMIGDGINDSTALAASTVGVAMGAGGTAMAVAAADVVLLNDNLLLLPLAMKICIAARNAIIQNCAIAVVVKIIAIVLAILGLLKFWAAVLVDIGTLLVVVINGTKLLAYNTASASGNRGGYSRLSSQA
jgi:Cd2+/Zn2+-exporting ATPase